ncbi:DUF6913 domain-containing protein [Bacteroidota bacterium]
MSTIKNIRSNLGQFNLKKRLKTLNRHVKTHNFNTAKSAGILFSSPDEQSFNAVKDFLAFLTEKEIKVIALGYVPSKKIPQQFLMRKGINFYCNTDLNWYYKPKIEIIEQFINKDFDLLFDLSMNDYFSINYVGSLSKAEFKIGKNKENAYQDLVIDINKNKSIEYLIEQIKHYINILNN